MRRSLAWLVAVPLMLAGSQAAHVLAYRWVYPQAGVRLDALVRTGHGYMSLLPFAFAVAAAVVALSLVAAAADAARGRRARPLPAWAFALLPLVGFAVQEHVERWLYSGVLPWHEALAPTFLPGLALELPFAALAYLAARLLLRTAERLGRALAPRRRRAREPCCRSRSRSPRFSRRIPLSSPAASRSAGRRSSSASDHVRRPRGRRIVEEGVRDDPQDPYRGALARGGRCARRRSERVRPRDRQPTGGDRQDAQQFTLSVPTEEAGATTTKIELTVPPGFAIDSFEPTPSGWKQQVQANGSGDSAVVQTVTWTGGATPTDEDSVFRFNASTGGAKTYTFDVRQTYSNGKVVDWNGTESSDTPAPTVEAVSSLGGGGSSTLAIVALALGGLALVVSVVGLVARSGGRELA